MRSFAAITIRPIRGVLELAFGDAVHDGFAQWRVSEIPEGVLMAIGIAADLPAARIVAERADEADDDGERGEGEAEARAEEARFGRGEGEVGGCPDGEGEEARAEAEPAPPFIEGRAEGELADRAER